MMTRNPRAHKLITCCVLFAVLNAYTLTALASPAGSAAPRGDLSARGRVTINGHEAISGTTVFSASRLRTERDSTALIRLNDLGHVALFADTEFRLDYDATRIAGALGEGGAEIASVKGAVADITAGDLRVITSPDEAASFSIKTVGGVATVKALSGRIVVETRGRRVTVAAGERFASGMASPGQQPQDDDDDDDSRKVAFLLLGIGGVVAAIVYVVTREDESSGLGEDGGGGINPSPAR